MRWASLTLVVLSLSCGYRFVRPSAGLPGEVKAAWVPMLGNLTAEAGAEVFVTQALREQLQRWGALGGPDAQARLEGSLDQVTAGVLLASPGSLPGYQLSASLSLKLVVNGETRAQTRVTEREAYLSGADVLLTEANRQAALRRLAGTLAREGLDALRR